MVLKIDKTFAHSKKLCVRGSMWTTKFTAQKNGIVIR